LQKKDKETIIKHACPWLEAALHQFRTSKIWHTEALCRTQIDLILFGRLSLKEEATGARNLVLKGEKAITTTCMGKLREINGIATYLMSGPRWFLTSRIDLHCGRSQERNNSQKRKSTGRDVSRRYSTEKTPNKQDNIYGVATDGVTFEFLRLDHALSL